MKLKKSKIIMEAGAVLGILIMLIGLGTENEKAIWCFMIAGTLVVAVSLIQAFLFYKCPYCNYPFINIKHEVPDYCPKCGKCLEDE